MTWENPNSSSFLIQISLKIALSQVQEILTPPEIAFGGIFAGNKSLPWSASIYLTYCRFFDNLHCSVNGSRIWLFGVNWIRSVTFARCLCTPRYWWETTGKLMPKSEAANDCSTDSKSLHSYASETTERSVSAPDPKSKQCT